MIHARMFFKKQKRLLHVALAVALLVVGLSLFHLHGIGDASHDQGTCLASHWQGHLSPLPVVAAFLWTLPLLGWSGSLLFPGRWDSSLICFIESPRAPPLFL